MNCANKQIPFEIRKGFAFFMINTQVFEIDQNLQRNYQQGVQL